MLLSFRISEVGYDENNIYSNEIHPSFKQILREKERQSSILNLSKGTMVKKKKGKLTMSCSGLKTLLVNTYVTHILLHT